MQMNVLDIQNWNRKNHYNYFKQLDYPHFNICGNVDITSFYRYIKENGLPLSVQAHHALVDRIHVGQFFNAFQEILNNLSKLFYDFDRLSLFCTN